MDSPHVQSKLVESPTPLRRKLLSNLKEGESAVIITFKANLDPAYIHRIEELGFHEGTLVECLRRPPFSSPVVFQLGGAIFAIESEITNNIWVEAIDLKECCQNPNSDEKIQS
jgi:Fe2+ transport system protein FeoA